MEEIEVASLLMELPHLIFESESRSRFPFTWGAKRRRSACGDTPSLDRVRLLLSSSSSPSFLDTFPAAEEGPTNKVGATSPATPLSFSPSESDEKRNNLKGKSTLKRREEWLKIVEELTRRKELLKGEVETVKRYYDKQVAINLQLKARKQELMNLSLKQEEPHLVTSKKLNLAIELDQPTVKSLAVENQGHHQSEPIVVHQQQFFINQMARNTEIRENPDDPYGQRLSSLPASIELGRVNDYVGPLGIPDLNVSPDEAFGVDFQQPFDLMMVNKSMSRAIAAQARQKRIQICRFKNSNASIKLRCSSR